MRLPSPRILVSLLALTVLLSTGHAQGADSESASIRLIDSGKAPKQPIRFTVAKGFQQKMVMLLEMSLTMKLADQPLPAPPLPTQKMTIDFVVTDVSENGDISYDFTYTGLELVERPGVSAIVVSTMKDLLKPLVGMSGKAVVTNRGITKEVDFKIPEGVGAPMQQTLDGIKRAAGQFSSPVPEEAVGPGAKWEVVQKMELNGIKLQQTGTHELIERTGDVAKMKVTLKQEAPPQDMKAPGMPEGVSVRIEAMTTEATGEIVLSTRGIVPQASKIQAVSVTNMVVTADGQQRKMSTETKLVTTISDGKSP